MDRVDRVIRQVEGNATPPLRLWKLRGQNSWPFLAFDGK